jgi:hypothetical protein
MIMGYYLKNLGSFWWKSQLKLLDKFKGIGRCNIGDGESSYFWTASRIKTA